MGGYYNTFYYFSIQLADTIIECILLNSFDVRLIKSYFIVHNYTNDVYSFYKINYHNFDLNNYYCWPAE